MCCHRTEVFEYAFPGKGEDGYVIAPVGESGILFSIVDGHGGGAVRDTICASLPSLFVKHGQRDIAETFRALFRELDQLCLEEQEGAVLTAAHLNLSDATFTIAQLGDTLLACDRRGGDIFVTPDHNVRQNLAERQAALTRGGIYSQGYVFNSEMTYGLQSSRALGDKALGRVVSAEPEIVEVSPERVAFLCSDGFVDPAHAQDAKSVVQTVLSALLSGHTLHELSTSRRFFDDATAIAVRLKE